MRRFISFFLPVLLLLFFYVPVVQAADTPNSTVSVIEDGEHIVFYGTADFALGGTDNVTTQAMSGASLDWEKAQFRAYTNAETNDDVNVFFMGGGVRDLTYISSIYTQAEFDDLNGGTPKAWWALKDTVGTGSTMGWFFDPVAGDRFKVIQFDGQTANPVETVVTWFLVVPKMPNAPRTGAYGVFDTT